MKDRKRIGEMNRKITIQKPGLVKDEHGDWVEGWDKWKSVYASIDPAGGREFWQSDKFNSEATGQIEVRYQPEIKSNMRVKYGSRIFDIQHFHHPGEARQRTVLIVKEQLESEVSPVEE